MPTAAPCLLVRVDVWSVYLLLLVLCTIMYFGQRRYTFKSIKFGYKRVSRYTVRNMRLYKVYRVGFAEYAKDVDRTVINRCLYYFYFIKYKVLWRKMKK